MSDLMAFLIDSSFHSPSKIAPSFDLTSVNTSCFLEMSMAKSVRSLFLYLSSIFAFSLAIFQILNFFSQISFLNLSNKILFLQKKRGKEATKVKELNRLLLDKNKAYFSLLKLRFPSLLIVFVDFDNSTERSRYFRVNFFQWLFFLLLALHLELFLESRRL